MAKISQNPYDWLDVSNTLKENPQAFSQIDTRIMSLVHLMRIFTNQACRESAEVTMRHRKTSEKK